MMTKHDIPLIDLRQGTPLDLLHGRRTQARELIQASRHVFGPASALIADFVLPVADRRSLEWLQRTRNPFGDEIEAFATTLNVPGVYALNICYEWSCTGGVYDGPDGPYLMRVMDWMFPKLGTHLVVSRQQGPAGEFYNITWPGVSGVFQATAPGRFAAAINQAPMRRHRMTYPGDWLVNRKQLFRSSALPPAHLLRQVFETAPDYDTAKHLLAYTPIALPVIYILSGTKNREGCIIERTEHDHAIRDLSSGHVCAANHFTTHVNEQRYGWRQRWFNASPQRARQAEVLNLEALKKDFSWLVAPIANRGTRLAMTTCPATGSLQLIGTHGKKPVTNIFKLENLPAAPANPA